jgi:hypothetical protein
MRVRVTYFQVTSLHPPLLHLRTLTPYQVLTIW